MLFIEKSFEHQKILVKIVIFLISNITIFISFIKFDINFFLKIKKYKRKYNIY